MATSTKTRTKAKAKPAPEPEEVEDDDTELEELEEDEVEEVAPKKASKAAAATVTFGVSDLVKYLTDKGHKVDARGLRTLIRKMARDGKGRVDREIVAGNRTRYDWSGPKDPEVKRIIEAFLGGELEADKQEKLAALKANKAKKDKAAGKVTGKKKTKKATPPPVVEDDEDEDLELDEDDE